LFPVSSEDFVVDFSIGGIFPTFETAAVDVWAESEFGVAGMTNSETVGIA
jgi:hypothetical protein